MAAAVATFAAGSPGSSVYAVSKEKTTGTRLARLLVDGGTHCSYKSFTGFCSSTRDITKYSKQQSSQA